MPQDHKRGREGEGAANRGVLLRWVIRSTFLVPHFATLLDWGYRHWNQTGLCPLSLGFLGRGFTECGRSRQSAPKTDTRSEASIAIAGVIWPCRFQRSEWRGGPRHLDSRLGLPTVLNAATPNFCGFWSTSVVTSGVLHLKVGFGVRFDWLQR